MTRDPLRFSRLKLMAQSPLHFFSAAPLAPSAPLRSGSAVHALLLGGPTVTLYPERRAGATWTKYEAEHAGEIILSPKEFEAATQMAEAVTNNPDAMALLQSTGASKEETMYWSIAGRECRGTPDLYTRDVLVELKTTRSARPGWFNSEALRMFYHAQLAWYRQVLPYFPAAYIIAVESKPPYPVVVFRITERALEQGERLWRSWLERLLVCEASDYWPGYSERILELDVPDDDTELQFADDEEEAA